MPIRAVLPSLCFGLSAIVASEAAFAAITLNLEMNPDPPRPNEVIRAQLTVANNGGASVAAVVLRATVPNNVNAMSTSYMNIAPTGCNLTGTSVCDPGDVMSFSLGTIAAGSATTVTVPFVVANLTPAGTVISLSADVTVSAVVTTTAIDTVAVDDDNALSLAIDEDVNGVASGGTLTYTLSYGNRGINSVTGTTLTVPLPGGATLVSTSPGGTNSGGVVVWNLGTLLAGQSGRQQVVVTLPGTLVSGDVVELTGPSISGTSTVPESAQAEAVTVIGGGALGIAVEVNPDPVRPNERLRTEITLTNRTGAQLSGVALRARVPESVVSFSPSAVGVPAGVAVTVCNLTGTSICDSLDLILVSVGNLPAGASVNVTLPPVLANGTTDGRLLMWETLVTATGNIQSLASHTAAVDADNALTLAVDEDVDAVAPGANLTYDLTYGNRSISSVTGATLTFPVPVGTTVADAGGGAVSGSLVSWDLGTVLSGESGRRQIVLTAGAGLGAGTLLMVDAAALTGTGAVAESARGTAATSVRASQPLGLAVAANPDPVRSNERLLTTITVTNRSGAQLSNVVVKARVPDNLASFSPSGVNVAPVNCNLTGTSVCDSGDVAQFSLGNLPAGASSVLTLPPVVAAGTGDGILLVWETAATADGNASSTMRRTVAVDNAAPLTLGLDDSVDAVAPDGTLTYSLTYGNRGITTISSTTLSLPLPAGVTFVSATDGGALVGDEVQWTLGSVLAGQSGRRQATVALNGVPTDGALLYINAASIAGTGAAAEAGRATEATAVRTGQALGLAVEANPDPVRQNEQLRTEIAVTNRSGTTLFNVVLRARVPDNTVSFSTLYVTGPDSATACNLTGTSVCDAGDLILFNLGNLAAGAGKVISLPPFIANGTESGRVLNWEAIATADGNNQSVTRHHVAVDNDNALTLAMDDTPNSTPANSVLTYVLTYGNRGVTPVTGATLRFPVPEGTTLLSSTGGTLAGNVVSFNLGSIAAGQGGRRQLRVQLGAGAPAGAIIFQNGPQISGTSAVTGPETSRASEVTPVEASAALPGLLLTSRFSPNPAVAATALTGTVTVTNLSGFDLASVVVRVRQPDFTTSFSPVSIAVTQGTLAGCNLTGTSICDATDRISWSVGALANGAVATLTMPPSVSSGGSAPANGQLLILYADGNDATGLYGSASDTLLVGTFVDGDLDGIPNAFDNCLNVVNPDQRDTDFDGYGNICDGDLNNSGLVTAVDFNLLRSVINQSAGASPLAAAADMNGSGLVTSVDFNLLRNALNLPPGPSALAP